MLSDGPLRPGIYPPAQIRQRGNTKFSKGVQKKWLASNFRIEMGSLPYNYVSRIEPFTVKQSVQSDPIGDSRDYQIEPTSVEFPTLTVTLAESHAKEWIDWHEDFVIKGNGSQDKELSGALVSSRTGKPSWLGSASSTWASSRSSSCPAPGLRMVSPWSGQPVLRPDGVPLRRIASIGL